MVGRLDLRKKLVGAVLGSALLVAAPAYGQGVNATQDGYSTPGGQVQQQVSNGQPEGNPSASNSNSGGEAAPAQQSRAEEGGLPFTGLQVGIILAAGLMLVGLGVGIRRVSRVSATS